MFCHKMPGEIEIDGERKSFYELQADGLWVSLRLPYLGKDADRHENVAAHGPLGRSLRKMCFGYRVERLEHFEIVRFKPGNGDDWEEIILRDWPPPMPF